MHLSLKYDYESSILRAASVHLGLDINVSIVVTSNEKDSIRIGFTREDSMQVPLGYSNASKIIRATIQALRDLLTTENEMIKKLNAPEVTIEMHVQAPAHCEDRRLRLYKTLVDKNIPDFEKIKNNPFLHYKTTITNSTIIIFIQRR